jgi:hypothetical protein
MGHEYYTVKKITFFSVFGIGSSPTPPVLEFLNNLWGLGIE